METSTNINEKKLSVKELMGCNHEGIIWGRLTAFFAAYFLANIFNILFNMLTQDYSMPPSFWVRYIGFSLISAILFTACIAVVFRFVRPVYAAILISTLAYSIINTLIRSFQNSPQVGIRNLIFSWLWTLLLLLALHISVQTIKRTWLALLIAYFAAGVIDQIVMVIILKILEPANMISVKGEFISLLMAIFNAAIFSGLFWTGLQFRWSRWETAGCTGAENLIAKPGAESGGSFELAELKKVVDTRMIKKMLRPAAIGSILFGIIAVVMGVQTAHANSLNTILAFIGVILILEGIWCAVAPQPLGLVVDGIVLIVLGAWNGFITIENLQAGGGSGGFIVLGIWQVIMGIKNIKQYQGYAYLANSPVSEESLQRFDLMTANINQLTEHMDESIIEFQAKTLFKKTPLKGKLIEDMILFVDPGKDSYMDKIANVQLKPAKVNPVEYPAQASLNIGGMIFQGEISQQSLDRFSNWQSQPLS